MSFLSRLFRGGWEYDHVGSELNSDGQQKEFNEGDDHFVVKQGNIYRQAKERGQTKPGYDWQHKEIPQVKRFRINSDGTKEEIPWD